MIGEAPAAPVEEQQGFLTRPFPFLGLTYLDAIVLGALTVAAALMRLWDLDGLPYGLHGDEAWTGIDARRILSEGYIGPYVPSALGQPAGPIYLAAPFVELLGSTVVAVRLPMALLGVATVAVGFFMLKELFGREAAYLGTFLLAFSAWLVHFNRLGFLISAFPFFEAAAILSLWLALRKQTWTWSVLAGVVLGLGIYSYFSYPLFVLGLGIWALLHLALNRWSAMLFAHLAIVGLTAVIVILPMLPYIVREDGPGYRSDRNVFFLPASQRYKEADTGERLDLILDNAELTFARLLWERRPDASDGSGEWPALDPVTISLTATGLGLSGYYLVRRRDSRYALAPILILVMAIGPILSIDGSQRRSLGLFLPVVILAAGTAPFFWRTLTGLGSRPLLYAGLTFGALLLAYSGGLNVKRYFGDSPRTPVANFTFGPQLTEAAKLINAREPGARVYFASDRWSISYETLRYLAPDFEGENRASSFAQRSDWRVEPSLPALIILIGQFRRDAPAIAALYPNARRITGPPVDGAPAYVAFEIPSVR